MALVLTEEQELLRESAADCSPPEEPHISGPAEAKQTAAQIRSGLLGGAETAGITRHFEQRFSTGLEQ